MLPVLLGLVLLAAEPSPEDIARSYREAHEPAILRDFAELLSHPNHASDAAGIEANAVFIRDRLREVGVDSELLRLDGVPPIVFGRLLRPGATRTLGIYVHYDGQPADAAQWSHPPFRVTLCTAALEAGGETIPFPADGERVDPEWRVYGRSAGDDKAPIAALLAVLQAFREESVAPTSNLVFFFEGEEESGSPHLREYLETYRDRVDDIDIWLFFDGPVHPSGRPQVAYGVRGVMGLELTVYGALRGLHSGHYGNWAPDTPLLLARLLASMKDDDGRVLVDGWYDTVDPLGDTEKAALAALPDDDDGLKRELGIAWTEGEPASLAERLLLPSLTVRGLTSANTGALAANVIPSTAVAALGIRLVRGNDPAHMRELIVDHVRRQGWYVVDEDPDLETRLAHPRVAKITGGNMAYPAARTSMDDPVVRAVTDAVSAAADRSFGEGSLVRLPGMGGTLPLYLFTDVMGKPALIVPVANHDDRQHAPDENLRVANLWYAIDLYAALFSMGG